MSKLTIFTPTFNRAYILPQLYNSLVTQTNQGFEWVIVDDGSSDNTEELVKSWMDEGKIAIVYKKQDNQGKHIAINTGVGIASGELFFIVDSDDYLTNNAVEVVCNFWESANPDGNISGIISYRQFHDGRLVGTRLPESVKRCKLRETTFQYGSQGDKVVIYRTDVLKKFPYPQFKGERFLGESYVFNQIDDRYDMLVLDDKLYYFAYQKDGLSQDFRKLYRNNPNGFLADFKQSLKYCTSKKQRIKQLAHIVCLKIKLHRLGEFLREKKSIDELIAMPLGAALFVKIFIIKTSDVKPYEKSED